jgi:hypothetical protein
MKLTAKDNECLSHAIAHLEAAMIFVSAVSISTQCAGELFEIHKVIKSLTKRGWDGEENRKCT